MMNPQRVHRMARRIAYQLCLHECPEEVAKDLEQAAWLCFLQRGEDKYLYKDLEWAMIEEVSRWLWNCRRGRGKNRLLKTKIELVGSFQRVVDTLDPERWMIISEEYAEAIKNKSKGGRPVSARVACVNGHPWDRTKNNTCRICRNLAVQKHKRKSVAGVQDGIPNPAY